MIDFEGDYKQKGYNFVAGMDEAGRGPLAGPVCCAICVMDCNDKIEGIDDSKKLSAKKREMLYDKIIEKALYYKICEVDNNEIDKINILNATKKGMQQLIESNDKIDFVLCDYINSLNTKTPYLAIVKGDSKCYSIACASILAKVYRDNLMKMFDVLYPEYEFAKHKGYGTKLHIENLKKYGKCEIHRNTFIKNFVGNDEK